MRSRVKGSKVEAQRFWAKVARAGPDDCWLWLGGKTTRPLFGAAREQVHRIAYALERGLPRNRTVRHTCGTVRCCNVRHMRLGVPKRRLSPQQVVAIRARKGSLRAVAREFGVSYETVRLIRKGRRR
jgi:hypothetical protein